MSIDVRTRSDIDCTDVDAAEFFEDELPERFEAEAERLAVAAGHLDLRPFTIEMPDKTWSLVPDHDTFGVRSGRGDGHGAHVRMNELQLSDLVNDQSTPISMMTANDLDMPHGNVTHFLDWWLVLRSALDARTIFVPGDVEFSDPDGAALDLTRSFTLDDDDADMRDFLRRAGYLHIAGMFDADEMRQVGADMATAASEFTPGDKRSWWAKNDRGENLLVRMHGFDRHSPTTAALLDDTRFLRLAEIADAGHIAKAGTANRIEALRKPIGIVEGISDVPWHKDCSLGRHSYECCRLTVGISVDGADEDSGRLRVVAGSHRALIWPSLLDVTKTGLPDVALPTQTGDVTVHLSCTLHMAQPPVTRERRVLYTDFELPVADPEAALAARRRLGAARESAPVTVDQPASSVAAPG